MTARNTKSTIDGSEHGGKAISYRSAQNPTGGAAALAIEGRRRRPLWIFALKSGSDLSGSCMYGKADHQERRANRRGLPYRPRPG